MSKLFTTVALVAFALSTSAAFAGSHAPAPGKPASSHAPAPGKPASSASAPKPPASKPSAPK